MAGLASVPAHQLEALSALEAKGAEVSLIYSHDLLFTHQLGEPDESDIGQIDLEIRILLEIRRERWIGFRRNFGDIEPAFLYPLQQLHLTPDVEEVTSLDDDERGRQKRRTIASDKPEYRVMQRIAAQV